jgi:hypothetical protein
MLPKYIYTESICSCYRKMYAFLIIWYPDPIILLHLIVCEFRILHWLYWNVPNFAKSAWAKSDQFHSQTSNIRVLLTRVREVIRQLLHSRILRWVSLWEGINISKETVSSTPSVHEVGGYKAARFTGKPHSYILTTVRTPDLQQMWDVGKTREN